MINKSSYYNGKTFRYDGRDILFQRVWGGMSFDGFFIVLLGHEQFYKESRYYVLCEAQLDDLPEMIETARYLEAVYNVKRWVGNIDKNIEDYLAISNKQAFEKGLRSIVVHDVPRIKETIDVQLELVSSLLKPTKYLYTFNESMIPAEMEGLPSRDIKAKDYPKAAALANVVSGLLKYGHEVVSEDDIMPPVEEW